MNPPFIKSEDYFTTPSVIFSELLDFLGVCRNVDIRFDNMNMFNYPPLERGIGEKLRAYFHEDSLALTNLIGSRFTWRRYTAAENSKT